MAETEEIRPNVQDVFRSLSVEEREQLRAAMSYPEDTVGVTTALAESGRIDYTVCHLAKPEE